MKKLLLILLALVLCGTLCSCSQSLEGERIYCHSGGLEFTASFSNGTMYFFSPTSVNSFEYELQDGNKIILAGSFTYTYEIDGNIVTFDGNFMGASDTWYFR